VKECFKINSDTPETMRHFSRGISIHLNEFLRRCALKNVYESKTLTMNSELPSRFPGKPFSATKQVPRYRGKDHNEATKASEIKRKTTSHELLDVRCSQQRVTTTRHTKQ